MSSAASQPGALLRSRSWREILERLVFLHEQEHGLGNLGLGAVNHRTIENGGGSMFEFEKPGDLKVPWVPYFQTPIFLPGNRHGVWMIRISVLPLVGTGGQPQPRRSDHPDLGRLIAAAELDASAGLRARAARHLLW